MVSTILIVALLALPPLPAPSQKTIDKLDRLPSKPSKILKSAENKAPIPDSLKHRFVEVDTFETSMGVIIKMEVEEKTKPLVRFPGPKHIWPHGKCYMCLGNLLIRTYSQSKNYLDEIGRENWGILYDNLQNDPEFKGILGSYEGWYENSTSYPRRGIFGRSLRR